MTPVDAEAKQQFRSSLKEFAAGGRRGGFLLGKPLSGVRRASDIQPEVLAEIADLFGIGADMSDGELSRQVTLARASLQGSGTPPAPAALEILNTLGTAFGSDEAFARRVRDAVGDATKARVRSVADAIRHDARGLAFYPMTAAKDLLAAARIETSHGALRTELRSRGILLGMPWTPPEGQLPSGFVALLNKAGAGTLVDLLAPDLRPQAGFSVIVESPVTVNMLRSSSEYHATLGGNSAMVQTALAKVRSEVGDSDAELLLLLQRNVFDLATRCAASGLPARGIQQALAERGIRTQDAARVAHAALERTKVERTGTVEVALLIGTGQLVAARQQVDKLVRSSGDGKEATTITELAERITHLEAEVERLLVSADRFTVDETDPSAERRRHVMAANLLASDDAGVIVARRSLPPEPPSNLQVRYDGTGPRVDLSWDVDAGPKTGATFTIRRHLLRDGTPVTGETIAELVMGTTWSDLNPPAARAVQYSVRVSATDKESAETSVIVPCVPVISGVRVQESRDSVTVTWGSLPQGARVEAEEMTGAKRTLTSTSRGSIVFGDLPEKAGQELRIRAVFQDAATGLDLPSSWSRHPFTTIAPETKTRPKLSTTSRTVPPSWRPGGTTPKGRTGDAPAEEPVYRCRIGAATRRKHETNQFSVTVLVKAPGPEERPKEFFPEKLRVGFALSSGTVEVVNGTTAKSKKRWKTLVFTHPGESLTVHLAVTSAVKNPVLRVISPTPGLKLIADGTLTLDL